LQMYSQVFVIDGSQIRDIPSFYKEVNQVFMSGETWELGASLDALNDLLYGGFSSMPAGEPATLIWTNIDLSRESLGVACTTRYYRDKLFPGSPFNQEFFTTKLREMEQGLGQTYFDIILDIIAGHPQINLVQVNAEGEIITGSNTSAP